MIKRRISTIIFILLAFLLQTTVFHKLALANVVPNLLLILTVCYSYMRGRTSGEVIGLVLRIDAGYDVRKRDWTVCLYFYDDWVLCGYCQKIYFTDNYILPCVLVGLSDLVYGFYYYITEFLVRGKLHFTFYFSHIILPELIYTLVISVVVFRVLNRLEKYLSTERREEV